MNLLAGVEAEQFCQGFHLFRLSHCEGLFFAFWKLDEESSEFPGAVIKYRDRGNAGEVYPNGRSIFGSYAQKVIRQFCLNRHQLPFFPHRALAAFAAIWDRLRGLKASALAAPPFRPPRRPRATAWGFLDGSIAFGASAKGSYFGACPVDSSMIWYASWFGSRGRFFVERSGMMPSVWQEGARCQP
jgi:hypothetical protein